MIPEGLRYGFSIGTGYPVAEQVWNGRTPGKKIKKNGKTFTNVVEKNRGEKQTSAFCIIFQAEFSQIKIRTQKPCFWGFMKKFPVRFFHHFRGARGYKIDMAIYYVYKSHQDSRESWYESHQDSLKLKYVDRPRRLQQQYPMFFVEC